MNKYIIDDSNACGNCPECGFNWNGEEIINITSEHIARQYYGWTPENQKHSSKLIKIEPSDGAGWDNGENTYFQCPECQIAWDSESGERTEKYKKILSDDKKMAELIAKLKKKII